jgi:hypothetical protein
VPSAGHTNGPSGVVGVEDMGVVVEVMGVVVEVMGVVVVVGIPPADGKVNLIIKKEPLSIFAKINLT